jgi:hypothetical protein
VLFFRFVEIRDMEGAIMTHDEFVRVVGRRPTADELARVNCDLGHAACGVCKHGYPKIIPDRPCCSAKSKDNDVITSATTISPPTLTGVTEAPETLKKPDVNSDEFMSNYYGMSVEAYRAMKRSNYDDSTR